MLKKCDTCLADHECPNCGREAKAKGVLLRSLRAEVKALLEEVEMLKQSRAQLNDLLNRVAPGKFLKENEYVALEDAVQKVMK